MRRSFRREIGSELIPPGTARHFFPYFSGGQFENVNRNGRFVAGIQNENQVCIHNVCTGSETDIFDTDGIDASDGKPFDRNTTTRYLFIITPDGTFHDLYINLPEEYGYDRPDDQLPPELANTDLSSCLFVPMDVSPGGEVICGWSALFDPWIVTLGEPVAE